MIIREPRRRRQLTEDSAKIQEAILYLLSLRQPLTQFQIGKALWFADHRHLNEFGRPVTFDNYVAMRKGPVPSLAYDALKPDRLALFRQLFRAASKPWESTPRLGNPEANEFRPLQKPNLDYLSETDKTALAAGLKIVLNTPPKELESLTHASRAYREAWAETPNENSSVPMRLSLIVEDESGEELAAKLAYLSAHA